MSSAKPSLPAVLPEPKSSRRASGSFGLKSGPPIVLAPGADDGDLRSAQALRDGVARRCGVALPIEVHAERGGLGGRIELSRDRDLGDAYRLRVDPDRVEVGGAGPAGLRYGVETLVQLVAASGRVPCCAIDDKPDFELRGLMLDVSRGKVPTAETLRGLVDLCVRVKLNVLMLYIEHTFRFRRHPLIGAGASPLSAATLRELDAYAAERHVELIPSLQTLGHMEHILKLPPYQHLAETDARWTISPAESGTYELLDDMLSELLPVFRSRWFNANCDEPFDLEGGKSTERGLQLGPGGVYLEHVRRVRDIARRHGKRTMIWGDVVHARPERIPEIDRDLFLLDWWYEADFDFDRVARFAEHGIEFAVCPGTSSWNCLFPRVDNSLANIARYSDAGKRHGARGLIVTDWGDFGHYNLQGYSWLGYAWAAQHAWSGDVAPARFDRAFGNAVFSGASADVARSYRELGAVHDAGFRVFNGSPLQFLYFDDLDRGFFAEGVKPAVLERTGTKLDRARRRLEAARDAFASDDLTWRELCLAAEQSALAIRKGRAGRDYVRWRRNPKALDARARRRLAKELSAIASEQSTQIRTLQKLWLERSEPSSFEITRRRLTRAIRTTRRASRALEANRPPAPPPEHPGFSMGRVFAALRDSATC